VKARDGGCIDHSTADAWTFKVCDVMFQVVRAGPQNSPGLLRTVRERYQREGRLETFDKIVGDGRLWVATIASLGRVVTDDVNSALARALALSKVYKERDVDWFFGA